MFVNPSDSYNSLPRQQMLRQARIPIDRVAAYALQKINGANMTRTYRRKRMAIVAAWLKQRISAQITLTFTKSSSGRAAQKMKA